MKKVFRGILVVIVASLVMGLVSCKKETEGVPQTLCPVMEGQSINKSIYVDYSGFRVYFCCKDCPAIFNKDPEKYMKKLKASGVTLEKSPSGEKWKMDAPDHSGHDHNH